MNIGIDIDDTITNTYEAILTMLAIKYGKNLDRLLKQNYSYRTIQNIFPNYNEFALENYGKMVGIVKLKDGVVDTLKKLKDEGHNIIFITARDYDTYDDPYKLSYEYLIRNGIPFDKLIVNAKDKAKECMIEGIDLFIDDDTRNCKAVAKTGIRTLQFYNDFTTISKGLERVKSWEEIYRIVQNICE